jgi:hypothetical protein
MGRGVLKRGSLFKINGSNLEVFDVEFQFRRPVAELTAHLPVLDFKLDPV